MNPTIQSVDTNTKNDEVVQVTLEEMDVMCRKCNQLHDEEIVKFLERVWHKIMGDHSHEEGMIHPHGAN